MHLTLEQKILLGFFTALTILLGISIGSIYFFHRTSANDYWVEHTHQVIETIQTGLLGEFGLESGLRGIESGGGSPFQGMYQRGNQRLHQSFDTLTQLTSDNPVQQDNLARMRTFHATWVREAHIIFRSHSRQDMRDASQKLAVTTSSIHDLFLHMQESEKLLLTQRQAQELRSSRLLIWIILSGNFIAIVLVGLAGFLIHQDIQIRQRIEEGLRQSEDRLRHQTEDLQIANKEMESFSYSVSHDLRAPLRGIEGFSHVLLENYKDRLDAEGQGYLSRVIAGTRKMGQLIDDILNLSRITRKPMQTEEVDLATLARGIAADLQKEMPERLIIWRIPDSIQAQGDSHLLHIILQNLLGNAWKFTSKKPEGIIELGKEDQEGVPVYFIRDNGAGFDMAYGKKLFEAFQRLHPASDYPGTGIGLATVQRAVRRHHGKIWADGTVDHGATFYFTLA